MHISEIHVLSVAKCSYDPGYHIEEHVHEFFHMLYVKDGRGCLKANGISYMLRNSQLYICPPEYRHEIHSDEKQPLQTIEVKFSMLNQQLLSELKDCFVNIHTRVSEIRAVLEDTMSEAVHQEYLYKDIINTSILSILLKILQSLKDKKQTGSQSELKVTNVNVSSDKGINFGSMIRYIEKNLNSPISLDTLSSLVGLNSAYLCRIFKERYGVSPIQYINTLRLKKAKELLVNSDLNITEIAEAVGFQTIHYFSRYFKEKENISPMEYKSKLCGSVYVNL